MSVTAIAWAKKQCCGSGTAKAVLVAVADYADAHGRAWPSQRLISKETEFTDKTVRTALQDLEAKGIIRREQRRRPDGSRATDLIVLNLAAQSVSVTPPPEDRTPEVGKEVPGGGVAVTPLTSFEPPPDPALRAAAHEFGLSIRKDITAVCNELGRLPPAMHLISEWLKRGYDQEMIREVVLNGLRRGARSLSYFSDRLAEQHAQMLSERVRPPPDLSQPATAASLTPRSRHEHKPSIIEIGRYLANNPPPGYT